MSKKSLFTEFTLKNLVLRNRLAMAPMTRNFSPNGVPHPDAASYYARRAEGGIGLIITEGVEISHDSSSGYPNCPNLKSTEARKEWVKIVKAVHDAGASIFCQLWHVGGIRKLGMAPNPEIPGYTPSGYVNAHKNVAHHMSVEDIKEMIEVYANDAQICEDIGFDGIELHGAHGYLIDQFFWKDTNKRNDHYGGSLTKRAQFACEIIEACKNKTSQNFVVGIRFSQWKQQDYDAKIAPDEETLSEFLLKLANSNPDFLHCSTRRYWEPEFNTSSLNLAGLAKKITGIPTISVGSVGLNKDFINLYAGDDEASFKNIEELEKKIAMNEFDLIAIGRALLSDPNWANKIKNNRETEIQEFNKTFVENYY
ncbi:MAG: NADH:flavin oxidoreductase [Gammaproteobacteria bacterium]